MKEEKLLEAVCEQFLKGNSLVFFFLNTEFPPPPFFFLKTEILIRTSSTFRWYGRAYGEGDASLQSPVLHAGWPCVLAECSGCLHRVLCCRSWPGGVLSVGRSVQIRPSRAAPLCGMAEGHRNGVSRPSPATGHLA